MFKKKKRKRGDPSLSRREFLYVALGGSAALFGIGACGAAAWALKPLARYGKELFQIGLSDIPKPEGTPFEIKEGEFWVTNSDDGIRALCSACPHMGTQMKWVSTNRRFECPSHGRKHRLSGEYIEGSGIKGDLFHYNLTIKTPYEVRSTDDQPIPLSLKDATEVVVDVRKRLFKPYEKQG